MQWGALCQLSKYALRACVCVFSGAVGGLMETFIYSSLFEGATSAREGYSHQAHMALLNTLHVHTRTHTHTCTHIPAHITLSVIR